MAVGDRINLSNIKAIAGSTSWRHSYSGSSKGSYVYYIHAPVFYFSLTIRGSSLWGYCEGSLYVDYLNVNTNEFENIYGSFQYVEGSSEAYKWVFRLNNEGDGTVASGRADLFRIRMYIGGKYGSCSWQAYTGGIEMLSESTYNSYFKGEKIKGCMCEMNTQQWSLTNNPLRGTRIAYDNNTYNLLGTY